MQRGTAVPSTLLSILKLFSAAGAEKLFKTHWYQNQKHLIFLDKNYDVTSRDRQFTLGDVISTDETYLSKNIVSLA